MVSATTRPPSSRARVDAFSWWAAFSGVRPSMVSTFQLSGRPAAAVISPSSSISSSVNCVEAAVDDALERRALVLAGRLAEREQLVLALPSARRRACRRRRSGWTDRVVENPRAPASIDSCSTRTISSICSGVASLADRVRAHHVAAQGAVADQEAGVDADLAVEPVEVLAEGLPVPVHPGLQGRERHALDLGHHPADVVGVLGVDAAPG